MFFAALTYFLSNTLSDLQYNKQDAMYDFQNLQLYQKMVSRWNLFQFNNDDIDINPNSQDIQAELKELHLAAFSTLYYDANHNKVIDFDVDEKILTWSNKKNETFIYKQYTSHGDLEFLGDSILNVKTNKKLYTSYGSYGKAELPATFVAVPFKDNYIIGYWLVMDYPLPADVNWPEIILTIAIILMLILNFIIIRAFLRPIQKIKSHVKGLKRGNLNATIQIQSNDELGELSKTINKMTKDIDKLVSQKQNLLIDVSHELKTPLTRLKFIIANMQLNQENTTIINKEINFLQDMISNMLLSDKLSTPYIEDLDEDTIALDQLIQNTCGMFYQLQDKLTIINNVKQPIMLIIDKYKMSLAIKNLIDNALKYGHPEKKPQLIVELKNNSIQLMVQDFGVGIAKSKIKEIVKPLYRGRSAKTKNKTGFGLGLAITKKIVEAHKGEMMIESGENQGSKFIIKLPQSLIK